MTLTRILQPMVLLGTLLLAANVHGQGLAESVITSPDSAAPKHFGHVTCSRTLPGCTRCTMFYVKTRRAKAASSTATTAAATPETFGRFRKVFVCQQCRPGFTLTGSQDPNDPNPASCIPNGGGNPQCPTTLPTVTGSNGFTNCGRTTPGSACRAFCTPPAAGDGYIATCTVSNGVANWVVTGSCTGGGQPGGPQCPAAPPADAAPNSNGFQNCQTAPGAVCQATCAPGSFGPGYTANCVLDTDSGAASWLVTGTCTAGPPRCPPSPPVDSSPDSNGFQNCPTNIGASCRANCVAGATGPGYIATCVNNNGVPAWTVTGNCDKAGVDVKTCVGNCGKRGLIDKDTNQPCWCDYWCNLYNDCCGGMNADAATAKDTACPDMAPSTTNFTDVTTCSNKRGVLAGVDQCSSYRPGGCWCDKFCSDAADCCDNCPSACPGANCPARLTAESISGNSAPSDTPDFVELCEADDIAQEFRAARAQSGVAPAAFTADLEARIQRCQDALIQTDLTAATINIPAYVVSATIGPDKGTFTEAKANLLINNVNAAFARSGFKFTLAAFVKNITFSNDTTLRGGDCAQPGAAATCERCANYRKVVPPSEQGSRVVVMYMKPFPKAVGATVNTGAATFPQFIYAPGTNGNGDTLSCTDGMFGLVFTPRSSGSEAAAALSTANTIIHELGHWLGVGHTWNQNQRAATLTDDQLCKQSMTNFAEFISIGISDGIRDTPPQLPDREKNRPIFFSCNKDGTVNPKNLSTPAISCNGGSVDGGTSVTAKYYNNFYNIMSYYQSQCTRSATRKRTFTAGQNARMKCVYRCYRANECGAGNFFSK